MSQADKVVDPKAYNDLVARAVLKSIRLTESNFDLKDEALEVHPDQWRKDISTEVSQIVTDEEQQLIAGFFSYEIVCRHRRKKVVSAQGVYRVTFRLQGTYDTDAAALFLERVGPVAAYPYFRSLVANLTSQAGIQFPPLPIISLAPRTIASAKDLTENYPVKALHEKPTRNRRPKLPPND